MNRIEAESPQKLRGGYYTPPELADYLTRWVLGASPRRLLEPSTGDGAFFRALAARETPSLETVVGCERLESEAAKARDAAATITGVHSHIATGDFLTWALERLDAGPAFDAVLGNPPFIRYQYLESAQQGRAEAIIRRFGLRFTKHTNAWVPFVIASLALLRPGGRLGLVVPSELLHVLHAQSARSFLLDQCARVLVLDPEELLFEGTLQGVVLLLAEKGDGSTSRAQVALHPVRGRQFTEEDPEHTLRSASFLDGARLPGKWMRALLSAHQNALLTACEDHPRVDSFDQLARAQVGIVTGANAFFHVSDALVDRYDLHAFAQPMFGRSEQVAGVVYDDDAHAVNRAAGERTHFLNFGSVPRDALGAGPLRYIEAGEAKGLHTRYKCRIRTPWYAVPSVFTTPVAMLKRSHHLPRLVLNAADAATTDTAYRVTPVAGVDPTALVATFVNTLTALSAELEGRHYGGGVLELVPSEIRRLLVPRPANTCSVAELDRAWRQGLSPEALLAAQDARVLVDLGLSSADLDALRHAASTLRQRRQRRQRRT